MTAATLASITVGPSNPTLAKGTSLQMQATGTFSDGSTQDLTSSATWTTSDGKVATVSSASGSQGLVQAVSTGPATITASVSSVNGGTLVLVTSAKLASIALTPSSPTVANGSKVQFTATGVFSDGTTQNLTSAVTWSSSVESVATVSNADGSQGLATTVSAGKAQIAAGLSGVTGTTLLTVTAASLLAIEVSPTSAAIAAGFTKAFSATGVYSDGSTQNLTSVVTWKSSDTTVAAVSNAGGSQGLATGIAAGTAEISASSSGVLGKAALSVSGALLLSIAVSPAKVSTPKGTTVQFKATGSFSDGTTQDLTSQVSWSSSVQAVATISNVAPTQGLASAQGAGSTTIAATKSGISGTAALTVSTSTLLSIEVQPASPSVPKGATQQFTAVGKYSDGSTQTITAQVTWSSANEAVVTVSNAQGSQGLATAQQLGTATIRATLGTVQGETGMTVIAPALQSIAVTPQNTSIKVGQTRQFSAVGRFSDGSTQDLTSSASWASSKLSVATINSSGLAEGKAQGMTGITASKGTIVSNSATLNVMP